MSSCKRADTSGLRTLRTLHALAQLGDGAFYVTSAAYLVELGWTPSRVGLLLGICWAAGALLSRRMGRLADRHRLVPISAAALALCAAGLFGLAIAFTPALVVVAFLLYASGQSAWGGLRAALVQVEAAPSAVVVERARLQSLGNAAVALGAGLGAVPLALADLLAMRAVMIADAALYLTAVLLIARKLRLMRSASLPVERVGDRARLTGSQVLVTAGAAALYLYMPMLSVALPIMVIRASGVPGWTISVCFLANTLGVIALQHRTAVRVTTATLARRALAIGGLLLAASSVLLWAGLHQAHASAIAITIMLGAGVLTQVLGEVRFAAGAWDLGYRLAPRVGIGAWQATYGAAIPISRSVGPVLLAPLAALEFGWIVPALLFLGGTAAMVSVRPTSSPSASSAGTPHGVGR